MAYSALDLAQKPKHTGESAIYGGNTHERERRPVLIFLNSGPQLHHPPKLRIRPVGGIDCACVCAFRSVLANCTFDLTSIV